MRIKSIIVIIFLFLLFNILQANTNPTITNISPITPVTVYSGSSYTIDYTINDPDPGLIYVYLFYSTNNNFLESKTVIDTNISTNGINTYVWDTTGVSAGTYYVLGLVEDSSNAFASNVSPAQVTISNTNVSAGTPNVNPTITNISPITPVTIYSGSSYTIDYTTTDPESSTMEVVNLYYSANNDFSGLRTLIVSISNTATNGANSYSWDTSSYDAGTYYILGWVVDSSNASASNPLCQGSCRL